MENELIEITGCVDCPFRTCEWDDFAVGSDMIEKCILNMNNRSIDYIIELYDTKKGEESRLETPEWCPLKNKVLTVKYK